MTWQPTGLSYGIFNDRYTRFGHWTSNKETACEHKDIYHVEFVRHCRDCGAELTWEGETWQQATWRVADHVAKAEENGKYEKYRERFNEELTNNRFMPGGRIWYGSGRPKAQLLNCFVVPTSDSREGWGKTISDVIVVSGTGGGVGINCSPVRPRGSDIKGTGGKATGAVSLMQMIDRVGDVLVGGGGRRLALMLCLDVNHPDLEEFLNVKLDLKQLTNANISVVLNFDPRELAEAIENDGNIHYSFGGRNTGSSISAKKLWNTLVENAWKSGEPGILNGYLANEQSNIWYHKPLISTNPCGEIWLEEYGCCCLGALVLPRFVSGGVFDWDAFDSSVRMGVRFLDDVLTVNHYPLPEIQENCEQVRRIGLGVMGLHSMLLELGYQYSSEEGRKFVDHLFSVLKNTAYDASINLAIEKGPFPAYDLRFLDSSFVRSIKRGIRNKVREHGIRNCALLTIAPTGTTGMVSGVSTGVEPLFAPVYWRRYNKPTEDGSIKKAKELVVTPEFERFGELAEGAYDVSVRDHLEMQKIVQAHVDNAVSKTINLPKDYPIEELSNLWLEYLPYCKGFTFYREGSRGEEPLEYIKLEDAVKMNLKKAVVEFNPVDQGAMDCVDGTCDVPWATSLTASSSTTN